MIAVIQIGFAPTSYDIGKGIDVGHNLVLAGAFALVCGAMAGRIECRERRLALAAIIASVAFAAWIVAQAIYGTSEPGYAGALVASDILAALAASALVAASAATAAAFRQAESSSPEDQSGRDGLLLWGAAGLGAALVLSTASAIVYLDSVRLFGDGNDGLRLATIGVAVGIGGAAVAAIAFFVSRRQQQRGAVQWLARREALIAAGLAIFFVGFTLTGFGNATIANASAGDDFVPQLLTTSHLVEAISGWILGAGAAIVAAGFLVSSLGSNGIEPR
jgi:hypothetical protein